MIPIAKPILGESEARAARKAILSGWVTQGPRVKEFEERFAAYVGAKYACAVSSCTTALHLALKATGVGPGDVVITLSHSFIATANAVRYCFAEPVFVDIAAGSFNISAAALEKCLREDCELKNGELFYKNILNLARGESPLRYLSKYGRGVKPGRVAVIMPVHQMGMPCDLNAVLRLARKFKLPVIEDAACAIGSEVFVESSDSWERIGRPHGEIACFSFHPRKVITTGDGGMLTTNNPEYDRKFRLLRQHGMSVSDVARHASKKVVIEEYITTGYNYRITDIQAAVGIEQLKRLPGIIWERRAKAAIYCRKLKDIRWLKAPVEPEYCRSNWQSYPVKVLSDAPVSRNELMQFLLDAGISTRRGIMNAHQEKAYGHNTRFELKESESARDSTILLPLFPGMKEQEINKIIRAIKKIRR